VERRKLHNTLELAQIENVHAMPQAEVLLHIGRGMRLRHIVINESACRGQQGTEHRHAEAGYQEGEK
jgi:hypothetical protein